MREMRKILCEILGVNDAALDAALESVRSQVEGMQFTPNVRSALSAVLRKRSVDQMMSESDISRKIAHSRRSRLGYDVLRGLMERGMITVER